jgi:hypothetical protein
MSGSNNVLDENTLMETPHVSVDITDRFGDLESNKFVISHDALDSAHTDNVTKGGLGTFHKSLTKAVWHGLASHAWRTGGHGGCMSRPVAWRRKGYSVVAGQPLLMSLLGKRTR